MPSISERTRVFCSEPGHGIGTETLPWPVSLSASCQDSFRKPNSLPVPVHLSTSRCVFAPEVPGPGGEGPAWGRGAWGGTTAARLAGSRHHTHQPAEPSREELWFPSLFCVQSMAAGTQRCPGPSSAPHGMHNTWSVVSIHHSIHPGPRHPAAGHGRPQGWDPPSRWWTGKTAAPKVIQGHWGPSTEARSRSAVFLKLHAGPQALQLKSLLSDHLSGTKAHK